MKGFTIAKIAVTACLVLTACDDTSSNQEATPTSNPQAAPLRPGVEDSSKVYKGTPSAAESAFWQAVRIGDDAARADAVTQLRADIAKDRTNGYSAFLVGASAFMPSNEVLRALAGGTSLPPLAPPAANTLDVLEQGRSNLTDPLYLGFDEALLGTIQSLTGDPTTGAKTLALAQAKNLPASLVSAMNIRLRAEDPSGALETGNALLEFCNGGPIDRNGGDVDKWVAKANAATLAHRECYSGYHAMHGTEGILLITGDLHALVGNAQAAGRYYAAMKSATNYATWPLKPLAERRMSGREPAVAAKVGAETLCVACHTMSLP